MRMPSKVTPYEKSTLATFPIILEILEKEAMTPKRLYSKSRKYFKNISEFVEVLDCLFILNKIEIQEDSGVLRFVEKS